ncbi:hypothetical protein [Micromonospora sp. A202]|uniref:hypothetical protein n=1 Tax=Micromonospora sp. A202 TaxID=2572899 RepID=UPI001150FC58|nr:hypothetical protein [Micromonospora sp. A202]
MTTPVAATVTLTAPSAVVAEADNAATSLDISCAWAARSLTEADQDRTQFSAASASITLLALPVDLSRLPQRLAQLGEPISGVQVVDLAGSVLKLPLGGTDFAVPL